MEPMLRFGVSMRILQESIRAAFPQDQGGGNPSTAPRYKGELPAIFHPKAPELAMAWSPFVKDITEAISEGICEGLASVKSS